MPLNRAVGSYSGSFHIVEYVCYSTKRVLQLQEPFSPCEPVTLWQMVPGWTGFPQQGLRILLTKMQVSGI